MEEISTIEELRSEEGGESQNAKFKRAINRTFQYAQRLRKDKEWIEVDRIAQLCVSHYAREPTNIVRIEGVVPCAANRLEHALMDCSYVTRSQWDRTALRSVEKRENYDNISIVERAVDTGVVTSRIHHSVEAWWSRYNNKTRAYSCVQCSVSHPIFKPNSERKHRNLQCSLYIRAIDSGESHSYVSIVFYEDVKYAMEIRRRERIVNSLLQCVEMCATRVYNHIYDRWRCTCGYLNDAFLLECRKCTLARYWKCLARGCRKSQPVDAEAKCVYCGVDRE
jgi:hypothetical protein